jgi:DNA-binding NarL/FixJ family response regulator
LIHKLVKGEVVAEVETGLEAVESTRRLLPDILLVDVNLPDMSGIEVTRAVASWEERVKVIVLSTYRDKRYLSEALKSGASGFLIKDCVHEELGTAIDTVTHDGTYLSPKMSETD